MKKILSYIVLVSFVSLNNFTFVFAGNNDSLQGDKQNSIILLDNLEKKLDTTLDSIETKIKDESIKEQIAEKQQEIENYINQKQAEIKKENSSSDIKEIIEETTKVVTLKAVAGVTPSTDITQSISSQIDIPQKDLSKAEDALISSLQNGDEYTLMLKSKLGKENILSTLKKFDENIALNDMFEEDGYNYFELTIKENSLFKKELLENIDQGEVPSNFLGIEVIKPELLKIGDISISGEETDKLWGIKKYGLEKYQDILKTQTEKNGKKLKVGIVDTGISYNHPDLKDVVSIDIPGYDFVNDDNDPLDDQGHGTHVSGTIAGEINGSGVFGVNPNVELVGLKICDSSGFCPTYGVLKALDYAKEKKIDILNMSLGAKGNVSTSPVCLAIKDITQNGTIVLAASGNSNIDTSKFVPGGCSEAITVAAIDENNSRASFSNYGDKVDVAAPGVGIYSTYLNNGYKSLNGTSMATPHIVGIVSILKTFKPDLTTSEIKTIFKNNSLPVQTETNKKLASAVDLEKILISFGVNISKPEEKKTEEQTTNSGSNLETLTNSGVIQPQEQKDIQKETISQINTGETITQTGAQSGVGKEEKEKTPEELGLVDISEIDESIGFKIQNPEEETTKINSVEGEKGEELINEEESTQPQTINLGENTQTGELQHPEEEITKINSSEEEKIEEVPEQIEEYQEENETTGIQNSYSCSFNIGGSCYLSLPNANNSSIYSYSSSANGYLSHSTSSTRITVYGNKAGTTNFYVNKYNSSKRKYELLHTIVITVTDPVKNLKATIGSTSIQNGNTTSVNITDGNGNYSVTSSNTSVATISGNNSSWTITGKGVGSSTITVKDSKNKTLTFSLSVTARNLILNTSSISVDKGTYGYFNIIDGNGGYTVKSSNSNLGIYSNGTNSYKIYSNIVGNYTVQVTDSQKKTVNVSVKVILTPLQEVQDSYNILQIMSNNGWWGDGYINEYKGKTRAQIEAQAKIFAEKLFNYKMTYDTTFRNEYNAEINTQVSKGGVKSDIEKGLKDGVIEGTKDYLMSYYDTVKNLSNLSFDSISNGVSAVWGLMKWVFYFLPR